MSTNDPLKWTPAQKLHIVCGLIVVAMLWTIPFLFAAALVKWSWLYLFGGAT